MKKLTFAIFTIVTAFLFLNAVTLQAQEVVLTDEFDSGDGLWNSGWIDAASATVTFSVDNTGVLSGDNSYKAVIVSGSADTYRIQRNANCALVAGYEYTLSFKAVADSNASINALFELAGDPYTKYLNEIAQVTTTPQTFTYTMTSTENVPTNQVKLHFGGVQNNGRTIWVDSIVVTRVVDPNLITQWGKTSRGLYWQVLNDSSTAPGYASMGGDARGKDQYATIRGAFNSSLEATTDQAVVVTGQIEFVGGGGANGYTWLRYALSFQDSSTLNYPLTDSAVWVSSKNHYGYGFHPRSGTADMSNGSGGAGTVWTISGGGWNSTWSNGGKGPLAAVKQAPRNAIATAGTYDFAISVKSVNDTLNEIRWYLVKTDNSYWYGGTVTEVSTSKQFNGVCFSFNDDLEATQVNLIAVKVDLGNTIPVPEAPWQAFYVDQWGKTKRGLYWQVLNDSTTIVGDASMGGDARGKDQYATIRGGFGDPIAITTDKAIIVSGQIEFVGGGGASGYTWLRYALTYQDSSVLRYALTDSARWGHTTADTVADKPYFGYGFHPRSGTADMSNGSGGAGTVWTISNGGGWNSTWSNGGKGPLAAVKQAPRNAIATAGTYNWAISVKSVNDTTNEIAWYLIKTDNSYWYGGTVTEVSTSKQFNGVCFSFNDDLEATQVNLIAVKVDKGATIDVPIAPWQEYYVSDWGILGSRYGGWTFQADPEGLVGNAGIGGTAANTGWAAVRAAFDGTITPTMERSLKVTGEVEFIGGGFEAPSSFRFGVFQNDNVGNVVVDATPADGDSTRWSGSEVASCGYLFIPTSGTNAMVTWNGLNSKHGTYGAIVNDIWLSTGGESTYALGSNLQSPANAVGGAGTYNFAISVTPTSDGKNEVRYTLTNGSNYVLSSGAVDDEPAATKFNGIIFALNANTSTTAMKLTNVIVDTGSVSGINPTDVSGPNARIPREFALCQNYPNPFNPSTMIQYDIPMNSHVTLTIYDILGRAVAKLVDEKQTASTYTVQWNAVNVSSGVYFYRINAQSENGSKTFTSVKKLLLMK